MSILAERIDNVGGKVDVEHGIVRGVKVLGAHSKNRRRYSAAAVREAVKLYQGVAVHLNHEIGSRRVADRIGWLSNVYADAAGGLTGDLNVLREHPHGKAVLEAALRNPALMALSHAAEGKTEQQNGDTVVTTIERVESVDLVLDPATTRSLFEADAGEPADDAFGQALRALLAEQPEPKGGQLFAKVAALVDKERERIAEPAPEEPTSQEAPATKPTQESRGVPRGTAFAEAITGGGPPRRPAARPARRLVEAGHRGPVPSGADFAAAVCGDGIPRGAIPSGGQFLHELTDGEAGGSSEPAAVEENDLVRALDGRGDWTPTRDEGVPRGQRFAEAICGN